MTIRTTLPVLRNNVTRVLVIMLLGMASLSSHATHNRTAFWFSGGWDPGSVRALEACAAASPVGFCGFGGGFAYYTYEYCISPAWRCGTPIYIWVSCKGGRELDIPYEGYKTLPGEPGPQCKFPDQNKPDLAMEIDTNQESPLTVYPEGKIDTVTRFKNVGDATYDDEVKRYLFLSTDEALDENDRLLASLEPLDQAAAGETVEASEPVTIPEDTPSGDYQLIAVANPDQYLAQQRGESTEPTEENYDNNLATLDIKVALAKVELGICVGNPISTNSGRKLETEVDYEGTGPFPLTFARYYSSSPGNPDGWNTSYSRHLFINDNPDGTTDVILVFDHGLRYEFEDIDARGYSDPDVPGLMARTANGFGYLDEDGTLHEFDTAGRLTALISRNGFSQTLAYQNDKLVSVTDHFGRELHLAYNDDDLLATLYTPDGATYRYEYNDADLLSAVVLPDNTPSDGTDSPRREYRYESPHLDHGLTGIIDENGNRFSTFAYDEQGRAVLSSHPGGAGQNTISYGENETTVTNPLGKQTTYVFEDVLGSNRLVRVDGHPTANCPATSTTKTYDARGSVTREVDAAGNVTAYTYTHTGMPDDEYLYHVGLVTQRTEAGGTTEQRTTEIEWHPAFRLPVKITEPGRVTEFTYDDDAQLVRRVVLAFDTADRRVWQYAYDDRGLLIAIDGPRTDVEDTTQLHYNEQGEVTAIVNALGHATQILAYDDNGLPLTIQDPNGLTTHLSYDGQRRLVTQTIESNAGYATTGIDYDMKANVVAMHLPKPAPDEDPGGQTLHYRYDNADRLVQIANDLSETIEFTLDADGNRTAEITRATDGSIVRVQNRAFDELGRLIETVSAAGQTTRLGYDNNDNLEVVEDALGRTTNMAFDALDRLISITDALNGESTFTYDGRDNLTSVTDAEGVVTTYTWDGHNNLVEEDSTASGVTRHTYDAAGNRIKTVDANGVVVEYDYDALNRLTAIRYPSSPHQDIAYEYDTGSNGVGKLSSLGDSSGKTTFQYDDRGNLVTDIRIIAGVTYTTRYRYNLANQLIGITYPSGRLVNYQLDNLGRVTGIATQATSVSPVKEVASDFDYLPFGPASKWHHGNGLTTDIAYDRDYRVTDIDVADINEIMSLTYRYNDVSNITRILDNLGVYNQNFQYDELNRLTFASGTYGNIGYTYDGVGNRLGRSIDVNGATTNETYRYEPGTHRIDRVTTTDDTGTSTRQFAHDANGNIVSDVSGEHELAIDVNARNRLAVVWKDGVRVGDYEYNGLGQRVAKTSRYRGRLHAHFDQGNKTRSNGAPERANVSSAPSASLRAGSAEKSQAKSNQYGTNLHSHHDNKPVTERLHFHYDQQGNLIAESDHNGNVVREYIYLGNYRIAMTARSLDKPGTSPSVMPTGTARSDNAISTGAARSDNVISTGAARSDNVISTGAAAGRGVEKSQGPLALYYIHNDHLGTPQKITDGNQRIVWSVEQTPFGEVALVTEAIRMPMRFPGQYADVESGFSYNYFRDYDPSLGRYIQSDPIGMVGGLNNYAYAFNNSIQSYDRLGLCPICGILGALVFGSLNAIDVLSQDPTADTQDLLLAFVTGAAEGFFTFSGVGLAGHLSKFVLQGALFGSISAGGRSLALDKSFVETVREVGISAAFGTVGGAFAHAVAVQNALQALKRGIRGGFFRSDLSGNILDFGVTYCGRKVLQI